MKRVMAVGIATLDIINSVDGYPNEDDEIRAVGQRICRGGNAANTLTVLSRLGHSCRWAGVMVDEPDGRRILADLASHEIDTGAVMTLTQGKVPTSYITHNLANGSRTIVHHRDLPEYPFDAFAKQSLGDLDWLHFEGRNVDDTERMMRNARRRGPALPISLEMEKSRPAIEKLLPLADVVLFSKSFALDHGYDCAEAFLNTMRNENEQAALFCGWGEEGAYLLSKKGDVHHCPAFPPPQVVDTLGAGDTFNAAVIDGYLQKLPEREILTNACRLAGLKCGHKGFDFPLPS